MLLEKLNYKNNKITLKNKHSLKVGSLLYVEFLIKKTLIKFAGVVMKISRKNYQTKVTLRNLIKRHVVERTINLNSSSIKYIEFNKHNLSYNTRNNLNYLRSRNKISNKFKIKVLKKK